MASWREKLAAEAGMSLKAYLKTDAYKKAKAERDGKKKKKKSDIVKDILKNTPAQQAVLPDFETTYTPELMAEDYTQAEALYKPYFEQQIANELEDLNAWSEAENVSYDRNLRRARFSLAVQGGAIGSERTDVEGEITTDHNQTVKDTTRGVERRVGTDRLTGAGYQSAGQTQEGALVGEMKAAIQEGQLWYKNQRAQRYYGNANNYYQQPSTKSLWGSDL